MQRWILITFLLISQLCSGQSALTSDEQNTIAVFKKISPLVVNVHQIRRVVDTSFRLHDIQTGVGSGFIWNKDGYIVTNFHVIQQASRIAVTLSRGKTVKAKVIGVAPRNDIALLKLENLSDIKDIPNFDMMPVTDSAQLQVGQTAIAIGNPFGLDRTLTRGIVSGIGREIPGIAGNIRDMIQTDASINPGNSGGPLLNSQGQLIGMTTTIYSRSGSSAGVGFAVPSNEIKRVVTQLIQYGRVKQAGISIRVFNDQVARYLGIEGVIIANVQNNSSAEAAGLKGTYQDALGYIHLGDIITGVNNDSIKNYNDYTQALDKVTIGDNIKLKIKSQETTREVEVKTVDVSMGSTLDN